MRTTHTLRAMFLGCMVAAVAMPITACNRNDDAAVATAEKQSASPVQTANQPVNLVGCVRAGEASGTFVLTTPKSATGEPAATYHLVDADEGRLKLADHVGKRVEVSGILEAQQQVATRSTTDPAPNPTGTAGTPTVSTATELDIKRVSVKSVQAIDGECGV